MVGASIDAGGISVVQARREPLMSEKMQETQLEGNIGGEDKADCLLAKARGFSGCTAGQDGIKASKHAAESLQNSKKLLALQS